MNKKILLCGAIAGEKNNFGDWLMTDMVEKNIRSVMPKSEFLYTSGSIKRKCKIYDYLTADCLIYIPGGYLGFIEKFYSGTLRKTIQRLIYYYYPGIFMILLRKPIIFIGQGVGPYEYPVFRGFLKLIFNHSKLNVVRDNQSMEFLRKIGVRKKIYVTSDIAQTLIQYNYIKETKECVEISNKFKDKIVIFILYVDYSVWKDKILAALRMEFFHDDRYAFVISADNDVNHRDLKEFCSKFPQDRMIIINYRNHQQLLSIFNKVDMIVTCKLHTGIVGCALSKSVICFALQYTKSKCYYEQIGEADRVKDINMVTPEEMNQLMLKYYDEPVVLPKDIIKRADKNFIYLNRVLQNI